MQYSTADDGRANVASESPRCRRRLRSEESFVVAIVLSVAGGCLDAFTWIAHDGVLANAQTANVVLLGVYAATGQGEQALRHIPPIAAFAAGVFAGCRLRAGADDASRRRLAPLSLFIEVVVLAVVMALHSRVPAVAGTLGISFVAALQTVSFAKVEDGGYSSVMVTGNLRASVELLSSGWIDRRDPGALRQVRILVTVCLAFAIGAGLGAYVTTSFGSRALAVPILLLSGALLFCRPR
jgi:uncharacterized membrane protein YoaK (UPF0700 family)